MQIDAQIEEISGALRAADEAQKVTDFDLIDIKRHQTEIAALRKEQRELEESNDAVKTLKKRLKAATKAADNLTKGRDEQVGQRAKLEQQIETIHSERRISAKQRSRTRRQRESMAIMPASSMRSHKHLASHHFRLKTSTRDNGQWEIRYTLASGSNPRTDGKNSKRGLLNAMSKFSPGI